MLQWTVFICLLAIIDGQPLYESNEDRDVYHVYRQEKCCRQLQQRMKEKDLQRGFGSSEEDCGVLTHETDDLKQEPNAVRVRWVKDYLFVKTSVSWNNAKEKCTKLGGYLVEIDSKNEEDVLKDQRLLGKRWWTGGRDYHGNDTWVWDSSKDSFSYVNWDKNQPDPSSEGCLVMYSSGYWHDYPCNETFWFICENNSIFS
uniref:CD209 antigen-like protein D isoform X2 n=1 Tax=Crassostrea virginica TaxID=6565 RepID=A0A8B8CAA4_CRAVI|nr:CD209 antigen-like protein D isoform X2 [Crassostrea virginica]